MGCGEIGRVLRKNTHKSRLICKDFMLTTATIPIWTDVQQIQKRFGGGHICQRAVKVEAVRGPTVDGGPILNNGTHPAPRRPEAGEWKKTSQTKRGWCHTSVVRALLPPSVFSKIWFNFNFIRFPLTTINTYRKPGYHGYSPSRTWIPVTECLVKNNLVSIRLCWKGNLINKLLLRVSILTEFSTQTTETNQYRTWNKFLSLLDALKAGKQKRLKRLKM